MPDAAREFEPILAYLNQRTCHQCNARFRDDNAFAGHLRLHRDARDGDGNARQTINRQAARAMVDDLLRIYEDTDG